MTLRRFRIAFSFAGEKRSFVSKVAKILAERFGEEKILYDKFHEAEFANFNLGMKLLKLYRIQSDLIVVIACKDYNKRRWCGLEWHAIHSMLPDKGDKILLCRFNMVQLPGVFEDTGFSELDEKTPEQTANLILERLAIYEKKPKHFYIIRNSEIKSQHQKRNCVLIRDSPVFNNRLLFELKKRSEDLFIGRFPYEESIKYKKRETDANDFHYEWRCFLDSDSEVLFCIYPENVGWNTDAIKGYINEINDKNKKIVFFESGDEFLKVQQTLCYKKPNLKKSPAIYVLRTDYTHAMEGIWNEAIHIAKNYNKRNLVVATLMPEPQNTPPANERRLVIDRQIRNVLCYRSINYGGKYFLCKDLLNYGKKQQLYLNENDLTYTNSYTKGWKIDEARDKANAMKNIMEYAEKNNACLLMFCGNDDMAFACYEVAPKTFSNSGCGILAGFDGFADTPFTNLINNGRKIITAQVNLSAMCDAAIQIVKNGKPYFTKFSANILKPKEFAKQ